MRSSVLLIFVSFVGLLIRQEALADLLEPECGIIIAPHIRAGTDAVYGAQPWMAYLYENENNFICGGSLIHKRFVLTAAHCILNELYLSVRLGEHYSKTRADSSTVYQVTLAIRNRLYTNKLYVNDIGMLRLHTEVQFNAHIRPICIFSDASQVPRVTNFTVTGWGHKENGKVAEVLQSIELNKKDPTECYEHMGLHVGPGQICAGHPTGDTCKGDSGSPLTHLVSIGGKRRHFQFGIVSYGSVPCVSPGVYTWVPFYAEWIARAVRYGLTTKKTTKSIKTKRTRSYIL